MVPSWGSAPARIASLHTLNGRARDGKARRRGSVVRQPGPDLVVDHPHGISQNLLDVARPADTVWKCAAPVQAPLPARPGSVAVQTVESPGSGGFSRNRAALSGPPASRRQLLPPVSLMGMVARSGAARQSFWFHRGG